MRDKFIFVARNQRLLWGPTLNAWFGFENLIELTCSPGLHAFS
jgi:hypothetical protein